MNVNDKFELLKIELQLIQTTLDKYDDLIFRGRNFFITLWMSAIGLAFTIKSPTMIVTASMLAFIYWLFEGLMRFKYWIKYVDRYRFLRNEINKKDFSVENISVYDLTNHFHRTENKSIMQKISACFFKLEPTLLYLIMGGASFFIFILLHLEIITFGLIK
ncbi:hypothetical protein [Aeromonas salmonicida]|uniref:hypothetical protein n=1 Tax=Aeromonas salmonicida TaxID=645 RepID=UPI003D1D45A2